MFGSKTALRLAFAGLTASAALAGAATSAQAATTQVDFKCKYYLSGQGTVSVGLTVDLPTDATTQQTVAPAPVSAAIKFGNAPVRLVGEPGVAKVRALATADFEVGFPDGFTQEVQSDLTSEAVAKPTAGDDLELTAAGELPRLLFETPGTASLKLQRLTLKLQALDADGAPFALSPPPPVLETDWNGEIVPEDGDPSTVELICKLDPAGQDLSIGEFEVAEGQQSCTVGTPRPYDLPTGIPPQTTTFKFFWRAPVGDCPVAKYRVSLNGVLRGEVSGTASSFVFTGLTPNTSYTAAVSAVDANGLESPPLRVEFSTIIKDPFVNGPTSVTNTSGIGKLNLCWNEATGDEIAGYAIYLDGVKVKSVDASTRCVTLENLKEDTTYQVQVEAIGKSGFSGKSTAYAFRTLHGDPQRPDFSITGSTTIKTLTKGTLPIKGSFDNVLMTPSLNPDLAGDLTLAQTSGRLTALGFLPLTAKIGFAVSGKATGKLVDRELTLSAKVRIKVQEVKLFGALPLAGGNNCQTKQLTDLNLKSTDAFSAGTGGNLAGTYRISDLNGCGALNGLVSPATAGAGNTIALKLTPKG